MFARKLECNLRFLNLFLRLFKIVDVITPNMLFIDDAITHSLENINKMLAFCLNCIAFNMSHIRVSIPY